MKPPGKCTFQQGWLDDPVFKAWIKNIPNDIHSAGCLLCPSAIISIRSMGRRALTSHMQGSKHKKKAQATATSTPISALLQPTKKSDTSTKPVTISSATSTSQAVTVDLEQNNPVLIETASTSGQTTLQQNIPSVPQRLTKYIVNENVTKAEIVWCLQTVATHQSIRSAAKDVSIFKMMFSDSEIAKKIELSRTKLSYTIVYGLAPYFERQLLNDLKNCEFYVIAFDESLNKISQRQQMDLFVRFWNDDQDQVATRYLNSVFLNRSTANDLLEAFKKGLKELSAAKLLQVSMDGPNVNFAFLKELKLSLKEDGNSKELVDFGSCGIHTVHCAFKNAMVATGWEIAKFLRAIYNLFKDVPARRGVYLRITKSEVFPKKFCTVRWLENQDVAQRAIDILPNIRKYVNDVTGSKEEPTSASYCTVKESVQDPMLGPKLAFFKTLAADLEPFLKDFQSNWPLAPFLHSRLLSVIETVKERFVRPESRSSNVNVEDEDSLIHHNKINIGFTTEAELRKCSSLLTQQISAFRKSCKTALKILVTKIMTRSPLKFKFTRFISCLDPAIALQKNLGRKRFEDLLKSLVELGWVSGTAADRAYHQYKDICGKKLTQDLMKEFDMKNDRLDDMWKKLMTGDHLDLKKIVKLVLCLSHGNSEPERGFSVNKECLIDNLKEDSLIGYRIVYDAIQKSGGVEKVAVTKSLINSSRNANSQYKTKLQEKKKERSEADIEKANLKRKKALIKEMTEKKKKLEEDYKSQMCSLENEISELDKS